MSESFVSSPISSPPGPVSAPGPVKVAFVALFSLTEPFFQMKQRLEQSVDAYFITSTMACYRQLLLLGVEPKRILNVARTRAQVRRLGQPDGEAPTESQQPLQQPSRQQWQEQLLEQLQERIEEFERHGPTFSSIFMMSRFYRGENSAAVMHYMALTAIAIEEFLVENGVQWVIAEPTNAVELLATVVAKKIGIRFGNMGFARLPHNRLLMFADIEERAYHPLAGAESIPRALNAAAQWLDAYRQAPSRPSYFATQAAHRSIVALVGAGWRNLSLLAGALTGTDEINNFRFSDLVRLYARPYFAWVRRLVVRIHGERIHGGFEWTGSRPYAVYFLHVCPERSVDVVAPWFSNQLEVIRNLRRALPSRCDLLVKEHPSATGGQPLAFYRQLSRVPNIFLLHAGIDSRKLMANAALISTISGTSALEAALLGTPALIFSSVFFSKLPLVFVCQSPSELPAIVARAVARKAIRDQEPAVEFVADILANSVASRWDGAGGLLPGELIDSFCELLIRATQGSACQAATAQKPE